MPPAPSCSSVNAPPLGHGDLPYAPIITVLRLLGRMLQQADPGRARTEADELLSELTLRSEQISLQIADDGSQARLFERLLAALLNASTTGPLVLVVEDLQWADRSTRNFLGFAVRAARPERLALIGTYRKRRAARSAPSGQAFHPRARAKRPGDQDRAGAVDPRGATLTRLRAIIGETPDAILVDRMLARSQGNPLFAEELLASALANAGLPESLEDALRWRLESVPADVRALLEIAAVVGRPVDDPLPAAVAGISNGELTAALRIAMDRNIVTRVPRLAALLVSPRATEGGDLPRPAATPASCAAHDGRGNAHQTA